MLAWEVLAEKLQGGAVFKIWQRESHLPAVGVYLGGRGSGVLDKAQHLASTVVVCKKHND